MNPTYRGMSLDGMAIVLSFCLQVEVDRRLFSLADEQLFPDLRGQLGVSLDQLERCQKALSDFLEEKRSAMPRFYFIGDEDLLEILGQVRDKILYRGAGPLGPRRFNIPHPSVCGCSYCVDCFRVFDGRI